jgi:predicted MFS family arabinose efflux permease
MNTTTTTPAVAATSGGRSRPRKVTATLAITQTVGYGVLTYSFPVLLTPISADLHATKAAVAGAMTVAVLAGGAAALPIGRWLDRRGGRALMSTGSILAVLAVVAWSQVSSIGQLYLVFLLMGLAGAMSLYEAAFPVIIAAHEPRQRDRALLAVTIVAGFASSIFFPLTGVLLAAFGWRHALLMLAAILAVTTIPAHVLMVPSQGEHRVRRHAHLGVGVREALRDRRFWLIAVAFVAHAAAVNAVGVLLVSYLQTAGHTAMFAATVSGLLGVLSVTGRLVTTGLARRHGMIAVTAAVFAVQAVGAAALPLLGRTGVGAAACVVAFGIGFGVATIARPAILADRYGTHRYATIAATMTMLITFAKAIAPTAAATTGGGFLPLAAGLCLISAFLLWKTHQTR